MSKLDGLKAMREGRFTVNAVNKPPSQPAPATLHVPKKAPPEMLQAPSPHPATLQCPECEPRRLQASATGLRACFSDDCRKGWRPARVPSRPELRSA